MAREITLRQDVNKALEASRNTAEAREMSPKGRTSARGRRKVVVMAPRLIPRRRR